VRLMPSGYAGVVFDGVVYPLHRGDLIRLEDEPVDKTLCNRFVPNGSQIPYAPDETPYPDALDEPLGVKWSQVQILSARQLQICLDLR
jgi:hypothetical protein